MKRIIYSVALLCISSMGSTTFAQSKPDDATLFTYGGTPVGKSEFLRMYTKNINNQKPDFSEKALREYVTLYSRFKMKVAEADKMKLDTLETIRGELGGYKKQLSKTYLTDKEVTERLVKEAYERMKKDVRVSHILVSITRGSDDTLAAYTRIDSIYKAISNGADFATVAKAISEDKQSAVNGGDIGFFTALQVVYPFESAAYSTALGAVSKPFRTIYGYQILKKTEERAARGEIQVSQIMAAVQKSGGKESEMAAKLRIDSVLQMLKKGEKFEGLVAKYSDDKFSKNSDGVLATFGVGQMVPEFEDAAFALKNKGDLSNPVRTEYGFHIIKLVKKIPLRPYDSVKTEITKRVEKDGRIETARQLFTNKIKSKVNYIEHQDALTELLNAIPDTSIRNGNFKGDDYERFGKPLFQMTGVTFNQSDFAHYIQDYTKGKIYGQKESTLRSLFKNYSDKVLMDYQENRLIDENEEYRNLITEYRDGIMLFELTDRMVWSKASADTVGLDKFYNANKNKYMWQPAVTGDIYKAVDESFAKKVVEEISNPANKTVEEIVKAASGDGTQNKVFYESGKFEKTRFPAGTKLEAGKVSSYFRNEDGTYSMVNVKEVFNAPSPKTLSEARGYVISEYQEYLEKEWIKNLEATYPVKLNESVLKGMVKK
jgi:peptidyl-prolyl cis-trans isomerase SurA